MSGDGEETKARRAARDQWSRNPAGTTYTDRKPGSPGFYDEMTRTRYELQPWHPELIKRFAPRGPLLEIGCGAGTDHSLLASTGADTVAIDLAHQGAWLTQRRLRLEGKGGSAIVADGEHLPFRDSWFASAYSFGVIHHTDHPERVAAELLRVLRPGAPLLVALYHRASLFTLARFRAWLQQGLPRRQPWKDFLAGIEGGAAELEEKPVVLLYSRRSAKQLFSNFDALDTTVVHLGVELPRLTKVLGADRVERLADWVGWYVVVTGLRPLEGSRPGSR